MTPATEHSVDNQIALRRDRRDVFSFTAPSGVDSFNSTIRMKLHNIKDKYRIASVSIVAG